MSRYFIAVLEEDESIIGIALTEGESEQNAVQAVEVADWFVDPILEANRKPASIIAAPIDKLPSQDLQARIGELPLEKFWFYEDSPKILASLDLSWRNGDTPNSKAWVITRLLNSLQSEDTFSAFERLSGMIAEWSVQDQIELLQLFGILVRLVADHVRDGDQGVFISHCLQDLHVIERQLSYRDRFSKSRNKIIKELHESEWGNPS